MEYTEKECCGRCPNCESKNITWFDSDLQDEFILYHAQCDDCNTEFDEEYRMCYYVTTYNKEK